MIEELPEEFFLFEVKGKGILFGRGPFEKSSNPSSEVASLYAPDFYLEDEKPFLIPKNAQWVHGLPFESGFKGTTNIDWQDPDYSEYEKLFQRYAQPLADGTLQKAVLVTFEYGKVKTLSLPQLCRPLFALPTTLHGYMVRIKDEILLGASPEVLFQIQYQDKKMVSEAVAGSVPRTEEGRLLEESTLLKEQHCVIQDIASQLSHFGQVTIGDSHIQELPTLAHLRSRIEVALTEIPDFMKMVKTLHPTGALGILPRKPLSHPLMRDLAGDFNRGRFGAPIGVMIPSECAHVVVAIRSISISGASARIGVGSGVHKDRSAAYEWDELTLKRKSIKSLFSV